MKIAYDAKRIFHNYSGLGNYGRTLLRGLNRHFPENEYQLYNPWPGTIKFDAGPSTTEIRAPYQNKIMAQLWRRNLMVNDLQKNGAQIYHGLSGELPSGLGKKGIPAVLTVHDLIFIRYPKLYKRIDRKIYKQKLIQATKDAQQIVAISEQTREDLIEYLHVAPEKIKVILQDCGAQFWLDHHHQVPALKERFSLPDRYALFVGSLEERKNPVKVAQACLALDIPLVLLGKSTLYWESFYHGLSFAEKERLTVLRGLTEEELATLYQGAEVFAYPSIFEGFGIPLLEAMASKTPLITANNSSLKEVAGPGSILIDAPEVEQIKVALAEFWGREERQKQAVEKNFKFARQFHTEVVAHQWQSTYQEILGL